MHNFLKRLSKSSTELFSLRNMTFCAMFAALAVVIKSTFSIQITPYINIGFSSIPNQLVDAFFGPITGMFFAGVLDIVKYMIRPEGAFFFGYTFGAMVAAFIYGIFYYRKRITLRRVFLAKAIVVVVVNMGLTTLWLSIQSGEAFIVLLPMRALKNIIQWPVDSLVFYIIIKRLEKISFFRPYFSQKEETGN